MVQARKIIAEGCEKCPNSEDVWFHAAELNVSRSAVRYRTLLTVCLVDTRELQDHSRKGCSARTAVRQNMAQGGLLGNGRQREEASLTER